MRSQGEFYAAVDEESATVRAPDVGDVKPPSAPEHAFLVGLLEVEDVVDTEEGAPLPCSGGIRHAGRRSSRTDSCQFLRAIEVVAWVVGVVVELGQIHRPGPGAWVMPSGAGFVIEAQVGAGFRTGKGERAGFAETIFEVLAGNGGFELGVSLQVTVGRRRPR